MKRFNQLILANQSEISEGERAFLETHQEIVRSGSIMSEFAVNLALNLKAMRDEKLFSAAGFETFADYTENAIGLKERQAYYYIKVVESFDAEFLHSSAKNLGIKKLSLLANLSAEDREQISVKVEAENVSVRELERQIKELKAAKEETEKQLEEKDEAFADLERQLDAKDEELRSVTADCKTEDNNEELQAKIDELQEELAELRRKPAKKEVVEKVVEKVVKDEKTVAELAAAKKQLSEHAGAIQAKEQLISEKEAELERLKKQAALAGDEKFLEFKIKFKELQTLLNDMQMCLNSLSADKQENCRNALKKVIGGFAI